MLDGALVSDRFERALECHVALHSTPRCTCPAHAEASSASCAKPFGYEDFDSWMESFIDNGRNSVHTAGAKRATFDGNDFHEMVVQVHQNPHWDGAGTIHGPGEAYSQSLLCEVAGIRMDPFTEPEFSPLILLRNHQMLVTI